jgi:hypothetical protein
MRKLTSNLFFLGFMVAAIIAVIVGISPHDTNNYLAAAIDKHRLLYSTESPKIVLVGGSNLAFSVDSRKIEESIGLPVVNMGLHADVGLRFMLNEVEPALGSGDIVVIFPEYEHFYQISVDGLPRELGSVIKFCPECISGIRMPGQVFNMIAGFLQMSEGDILRSIKAPEKPEKIYFRQGFNEWGDLVSHLKKTDKLAPNNHVYDIRIISPNSAIDSLNSFYRSQKAADARIFFMFPAIPMDEYNAQEEKFLAFYDFLASELEIPVIGTPQDFIYPEEFFYDTVYHMNRVGRDARTDRIIELLSSALQK